MFGKKPTAATPSGLLPAGTVADLRNAVTASARAMDKTDAAQLKGLEHQVRQLERQVESRDREITRKNRRITDLEQQVAASRRGESALVDELRQQLTATQRQLDNAMGYDSADLLRIAAHTHPFAS